MSPKLEFVFVRMIPALCFFSMTSFNTGCFHHCGTGTTYHISIAANWEDMANDAVSQS